MVDPKIECHCPFVRQNADFFNQISRDRVVRSQIQREGYDRVTPLLIRSLLLHPDGSFYTTAFEDKLRFSHTMATAIRNFIIRRRWELYLYQLETDPNHIRCPPMQSFLQEKNYDPEYYLQYLREQHP
jgi:hypothetical protein